MEQESKQGLTEEGIQETKKNVLKFFKEQPISPSKVQESADNWEEKMSSLWW
ncbi:MAG: hypothetical protein QGF25_07115 [Candidatus Woesearchaeota archaeon]|jgi:hypothetical protein|nr:hypothetical protein [Candidatus Woesearchaeota archaeon]